MEKLPTEITENILDPLPIETALRAKQVCKSWRFLLRSKTDKVGLLIAESNDYSCPVKRKQKYQMSKSPQNSYQTRRKNKLYYGDQFDHIRGNMNYTHFPLGKKMDNGKSVQWSEYMDNMLGSCNGLVCFQREYPTLMKPFLIFNPITREVLYVPKYNPYTELPSLSGWPRDMISGFGYCHSTNEYKIVTMHHLGESSYDLQVYTVGGGWRTKESICITELDSPTGIYANGALHWLNSNDYSIMAFGLEDEEFHFIPLSCVADVNQNHRPKLVRGNYLYLVNTIFDDKPYCTYIWSYKRKTTNGCDVKLNYNDKNLWHWIMEFRIEWEETYWKELLYFEPLAITTKNEIVFRCKSRLSWYDLNTSTLTELSFVRCNMTDKPEKEINVIPHANSIVSISEVQGSYERNLNLSSEEKITKTNARDSKRKERELRRLEWNVGFEDLRIEKQENLGRGQRSQAKKRKA